MSLLGGRNGHGNQEEKLVSKKWNTNDNKRDCEQTHELLLHPSPMVGPWEQPALPSAPCSQLSLILLPSVLHWSLTSRVSRKLGESSPVPCQLRCPQLPQGLALPLSPSPPVSILSLTLLGGEAQARAGKLPVPCAPRMPGRGRPPTRPSSPPSKPLCL